ncbi:MAG: hypothetical protein CFH19_00290 [Alphaproteobacteria bacterium MarineAlpha5_Bin9]|nr:MAG: hypothetical protein CFH19_00290 [Alphaproteobacteria bacterium MarineAlpha5_Bin9]|tara:strand:+ start:1191 stop:1469 length:279 start_codon:yes stop_codon:yes gene_type:complete
MSNKTKILSELSKILVESMNTFRGLKEEIETIVKLRVERTINRMQLVKRAEFEALKISVQKLSKEKNIKKSQKKRKKTKKSKKNQKKSKKQS